MNLIPQYLVKMIDEDEEPPTAFMKANKDTPHLTYRRIITPPPISPYTQDVYAAKQNIDGYSHDIKIYCAKHN